MNLVSRVGLSLLAGIVAFVLVGGIVTVWLVRWIELSLMLGIPMGLTAGLTALAATYVALTYRSEQAAGSVSLAARRRLWAGAAAVATFGGVTALGFGLFFYGNGDDGVFVLLFGLPVMVLVGALVGDIAARMTHGRSDTPRMTAP